MSSDKPIPVRLSFVRLQQCVDLLKILCFEPMQNLSFDVSRMLKKCLQNLTGEVSRFVNAMESSSQSRTIFKAAKLNVLSAFI